MIETDVGGSCGSVWHDRAVRPPSDRISALCHAATMHVCCPPIMQSDLKDLLNIQEGHFFDYQDIVDDRRKLEMCVRDAVPCSPVQCHSIPCNALRCMAKGGMCVGQVCLFITMHMHPHSMHSQQTGQGGVPGLAVPLVCLCQHACAGMQATWTAPQPQPRPPPRLHPQCPGRLQRQGFTRQYTLR
eukprot:363929-Chlamydomonas_euryale.AAC.5